MVQGNFNSNSFSRFFEELKAKVKGLDHAKVCINVIKQDIRILPVIH